MERENTARHASLACRQPEERGQCLLLCIPKITSASKRSRWRALPALIFDNGVAGVPAKPGVTA
jgi:hypothetical protein